MSWRTRSKDIFCPLWGDSRLCRRERTIQLKRMKRKTVRNMDGVVYVTWYSGPLVVGLLGSMWVLSDMANNQRDRWKNGKRFANIPVDKIKILWIIVGERKEEGCQHQHQLLTVV